MSLSSVSLSKGKKKKKFSLRFSISSGFSQEGELSLHDSKCVRGDSLLFLYTFFCCFYQKKVVIALSDLWLAGGRRFPRAVQSV